MGSWQTEFPLYPPGPRPKDITRCFARHHMPLHPSDPALGSSKGVHTPQPFFVLLPLQAQPKDFLTFLSPCSYSRLPAHIPLHTHWPRASGPSIPHALAEQAQAALMGQQLPAEAEGAAQPSRQIKAMKPRMVACPLHGGRAANLPPREWNTASVKGRSPPALEKGSKGPDGWATSPHCKRRPVMPGPQPS